MRIFVLAALLGTGLFGQTMQSPVQPAQTPESHMVQVQTPQSQTAAERLLEQLRARAQAAQQDSQQKTGQTGRYFKFPTPAGVPNAPFRVMASPAPKKCAIPLLNAGPGSWFKGDPKMPIPQSGWNGDPKIRTQAMPVCGKP